MVPRRAILRLRAASVRCTMYWSVHQYQSPTMGAAKSMPGQGKSGSFQGRHRLSMVGPQASRTSPQPPILNRPMEVMAREPTMSTTACMASVYTTARMPPMTV